MSKMRHADEWVTVHEGDCLEVMAQFKGDSIDAVVTDPPYGLEFMGKDWDRFAGAVSDRDFKGFVLSQQRTRNVKCPECGKWAYDHPGRLCGCGGIRRAQGNAFQHWCEQWAAECLRVLKPGGHMLAFGGTRTYHRLACAVEDAGFEIRDSIAWLYGSGFPKSLNLGEGRGTALKPAFEPIVVGRKPLRGTVAVNVVEHGTGALNIDACRVQYEPADLAARTARTGVNVGRAYGHNGTVQYSGGEVAAPNEQGRWPTNVVLDGDQADELDRQSGITKSTGGKGDKSGRLAQNVYGDYAGTTKGANAGGIGDSGGASRFFPVFRYQAKADSVERPVVDGVAHPTVKPLDLMRWLVRLVTPPGGTVLDPFAGSGTTAEACVHEHLHCITIEREADYIPLIKARLSKPMEIGFDFGEAL